MSKKLLVIIVSLVVVLGGLGGAYVWLSKGEAKEPTEPTTKVEKVDKNAEEAKQKEMLKKESERLITRMNEVHLLKSEQEFESWLTEVFFEPEKFRETYKPFLKPGDYTNVKVSFVENTVNLPNEDGVFSTITKYKVEITGESGKIYTQEETLSFNYAKNTEGKYTIFLITQ